MLDRFRKDIEINHTFENHIFCTRLILNYFSCSLVILCSPLSLPSLYLSNQLSKRKYLGSLFNEHAALMLLFSGRFYEGTDETRWISGVILPLNLGTAILRLLMEHFPDTFPESQAYIPLMCVSLQHLYVTWIRRDLKIFHLTPDFNKVWGPLAANIRIYIFWSSLLALGTTCQLLPSYSGNLTLSLGYWIIF